MISDEIRKQIADAIQAKAIELGRELDPISRSACCMPEVQEDAEALADAVINSIQTSLTATDQNGIRPCPFCKSSDIRYSIKASKTTGQRQYRATMYCNGCHTYGPRVLTPYINQNDYKGRNEIEADDSFRHSAILLWNSRCI